jgi:sarcosine oxidase
VAVTARASSTERFDYAVVGLGALGSAAAMELARRGHSVVGLERFELGHSRGASHDTSRILRHSYHTPSYVRLTLEAYADWARLERDTGMAMGSTVGGLDLFPPDAAIAPKEYIESLDDVGIDYEQLDGAEATRRWPQFRLPEGTLVLHQRDAAIVPAALGTATMQAQATRFGAMLKGNTPVTELQDTGGAVRLTTPAGVIEARAVVVCADAWTNQILAGLDLQVPLEVTLEQVTYFRPGSPTASPPTGTRSGSGWTTRATTASPATASPRSRRPRTAAVRWSTPTTGPRTPTPRWPTGSESTSRAPCRARASQCARCAASTP